MCNCYCVNVSKSLSFTVTKWSVFELMSLWFPLKYSNSFGGGAGQKLGFGENR